MLFSIEVLGLHVIQLLRLQGVSASVRTGILIDRSLWNSEIITEVVSTSQINRGVIFELKVAGPLDISESLLL